MAYILILGVFVNQVQRGVASTCGIGTTFILNKKVKCVIASLLHGYVRLNCIVVATINDIVACIEAIATAFCYFAKEEITILNLLNTFASSTSLFAKAGNSFEYNLNDFVQHKNVFAYSKDDLAKSENEFAKPKQDLLSEVHPLQVFIIDFRKSEMQMLAFFNF